MRKAFNFLAGALGVSHARRARSACLQLVVLAFIGGCDRSTPPEATKRARTGFVAFVGRAGAEQIWQVLRGSAERYARTADFEVRFFPPSSDPSLSQQKVLESLMNEQVRGVCLQLGDEESGLLATVEQMNTRGVPFVSMMEPLPGRLRFSHVGVAEEDMGRNLADATIRALGTKATIMLLHAGREHPVYGPRLAAFEKRIEFYPGIEVFAQVDCELDPGKARELLRERTARFPRLSAWVSVGDWPLRDHADLNTILPSECRFIPCAITPAVWPLIRSGRCPAAVTADLAQAGAKAVQFCEIAQGDQSNFTVSYDAPASVLTLNTLDQYVRDWTECAAPTSRPSSGIPVSRSLALR